MNLHDDAFHIYSVREVFIECFRQRIVTMDMLRIAATQNNRLKYTLSSNGAGLKLIGPLVLFTDQMLKMPQEAPKSVL